MSEKQEVAKKPEFTTSLSRWSNEITNLVAGDFEKCGVKFDDYSKDCAMAAVGSIYQLVTSSAKEMKNVNTSNLRQVVAQVASLKLNANSLPKECYFSLRNKKNASGQWEQFVELGIEGDGNDALLRQHGQNVKMVYPCWLVKEGDVFEYPKHRGIELEPPIWEEKGLSTKVVRVVYPVKLKDGNMTYLIAERSDVRGNLVAHIRNNLMNETFGVCENRYKATPKQLEEIKKKKEEVMAKVRELPELEDIIGCADLAPYISLAWLDSPEAMFVRKMRNNAVRKFPKSLNTMASQSLFAMDETYKQAADEIEENENSEVFDEEEDIIDVDGSDVE